MPLFSIIIPVKNRSEYLPLLVDMLIAQTHGEWEAVLVDDGSSHAELAAIEAQCRRDGRIRFFGRAGDRPGAPACRNQGFAHSRGEYVIFLDSDDCLSPDCLAERLRCMEAHPELDFGVFPCRLFREQPGDTALLHNAATGENDLDRYLRLDVPWQTTSPAWRRGALERLGPWNEALPSWQDWEFHIRALANGFKYRRFACGGSFWRVPTAGAIGPASNTAAHLRAQEDAVHGVVELLEARSLLTQARRAALAGTLLRIGLSWIEAGNRDQALRLWLRCLDRKLIKWHQYLAGLPVILLHPVPHAGRAVRVIVRRMWPKHLYPVISKTAFLTPESHLSDEAGFYSAATPDPSSS